MSRYYNLANDCVLFGEWLLDGKAFMVCTGEWFFLHKSSSSLVFSDQKKCCTIYRLETDPSGGFFTFTCLYVYIMCTHDYVFPPLRSTSLWMNPFFVFWSGFPVPLVTISRASEYRSTQLNGTLHEWHEKTRMKRSWWQRLLDSQKASQNLNWRKTSWDSFQRLLSSIRVSIVCLFARKNPFCHVNCTLHSYSFLPLFDRNAQRDPVWRRTESTKYLL